MEDFSCSALSFWFSLSGMTVLRPKRVPMLKMFSERTYTAIMNKQLSYGFCYFTFFSLLPSIHMISDSIMKYRVYHEQLTREKIEEEKKFIQGGRETSFM